MSWHGFKGYLLAIGILTALLSMAVYTYVTLPGSFVVSRSYLAQLVPGHASTLRGFDPRPLAERLSAAGFRLGMPVTLRLFKEEGQLEVWMEKNDRFVLVRTYDICKWSGTLGPKLQEGDGQSPEGFYFATARQLKPDSAYYRAINVGFPNAFDLESGRTGSFLMIHGNCVSIGCYAMTDAGIDDIYSAVEAALNGGQEAVPIHIFPFRMTLDNLQRHAGGRWHGFWENLAEGDRIFLATGKPPRVAVCAGRYAFTTNSEPLPTETGCKSVTGW